MLTASLTHPYVRDLAWVASSPWLLRWPGLPTPMPCSQVDTHWLAALEANPEPLQQHLQSANTHLLGHYYEALWAFLLAQDPSKQLLHRNLPVIQGQRTLGEFDLIYYCKVRKTAIHLELAVKFYLGLTTALTQADSWDRWLGPGCRDTLELKLNKLLHKQLRLSQTAAGKATLAAHGIHKIEPAWAVQGYLFYPAAHACPPPRGAHPQHAAGRWFTLQHWLQTSDNGSCGQRWQLLRKPHWLAPQPLPPSDPRLLTRHALDAHLRHHFQQHQAPQLVARLSQTPNGDWLEQERLFITGDQWPERPPAPAKRPPSP